MKTKKEIELFYNQLLFPMFPSEERDDLKNLIYYTKNQNTHHKFKILAMMDGEKIAGGVVFDYYKDTNTILMEYVSTKPDYRGKGIASILIDKVLAKYHAAYCIIEVEDPSKICTLEAVKRLEFWKNKGFKKVSLHYVQPPINKSKSAVNNMMLMCKVLGNQSETNSVPASIIENTLKHYFSYSMRLKKSDLEKFLNFKPLDYLIG